MKPLKETCSILHFVCTVVKVKHLPRLHFYRKHLHCEDHGPRSVQGVASDPPPGPEKFITVLKQKEKAVTVCISLSLYFIQKLSSLFTCTWKFLQVLIYQAARPCCLSDSLMKLKEKVFDLVVVSDDFPLKESKVRQDEWSKKNLSRTFN